VKPRVIGLDLSLTATGICYADGSVGTVPTRSGEGDRRLVNIRQAVAIAIGGATLVVVEDLPTHAKSAGITGMVHGVVRELLTAIEIPYALVPPATLKKYATGRGNATKPDMRVALLKRTGMDLRDDNECDAWWLRAMGLDQLGRPLLVSLPQAQRDALVKVDWPGVKH
jgi:Holliday junction resolvasome RuvABC endonuclease subunit